MYVPVRSTIANQPVTHKQTIVPGGEPGFRDAAYYSVQSATSLLREPTSEPLTTSGRITEIALRLLGLAASRPRFTRSARTGETVSKPVHEWRLVREARPRRCC